MAEVLNVHQIVFALEQHGRDMEAAVQAELDVLASMANARMRRMAPKFQSHLVDSIQVSTPEPMVREIRPGIEYSAAVEFGVKPGGKGLPKWAKAPQSMLEWLQASSTTAGPRTGSRLRDESLGLRDRYEGLAWHIRHHGVKPQPFVAPVHEEMKPIVLSRMDLAVRRVLAARPDDGGATA